MGFSDKQREPSVDGDLLPAIAEASDSGVDRAPPTQDEASLVRSHWAPVAAYSHWVGARGAGLLRAFVKATPIALHPGGASLSGLDSSYVYRYSSVTRDVLVQSKISPSNLNLLLRIVPNAFVHLCDCAPPNCQRVTSAAL